MALIERRIGLLFAIFLLLLVAAAARATQLTVLKGPGLKRQAIAQQRSKVVTPGPRGPIVDRHGKPLAIAQAASDISATPYLITDHARAAKKLSVALGVDPDSILAKLADRKAGFVFIARSVSGNRAAAVERAKIPGVTRTPVSQRTYPQKSLASQALGFVGIDGDGLSGLELTYDKQLRGTDGVRRVIQDARGKPISLLASRPARTGKELKLTIDTALQLKTEAVLSGVGKAFRPKGATVIVMDPRNSDILALANWPRVDANKPGSAPEFARQNRAIAATYEPGSTFKSITIAGALEDRIVTPETSFGLAPTIQVADRQIGESHDRGAVTLTVRQILEQSSNVGAVTVGLKLGAKGFDEWVRRFGFGTPTGIDLPGEEQGIVPRHQDYSGSSMGNLPIGQGLTLTPIQIATAYAAIANGGILRPPRIVSSVGGRSRPSAKGRRVVSARTANQLRSMLEGVLGPGGTASEAAIPGYSLAGKTGTANKIDGLGGYSKSKYVASFIGFAPAKDPRLLVAVMVDEPQGLYYGGQVAAPAFQKIVSFGLPYLQIPPR